MRTFIQRVKHASVRVNEETLDAIDAGLCILIGFEDNDKPEDLDWTIHKLVNMRVFNDQDEKMNLSLKDIDGKILVISQFTLFAKTKKGNRPSFIEAAKAEYALKLYQIFLIKLKDLLGPNRIASGRFGADMDVTICNTGPVSIWLDSKDKY